MQKPTAQELYSEYLSGLSLSEIGRKFDIPRQEEVTARLQELLALAQREAAV